MSFNNYPEYQEIKSLSWSIPKHWTAPKLAHLLRLQSGDSITSENIEVEGDYAVYGGNGLRGYTDKYNCIGEYILVGRQGALCGNVHVASGKFFASEHAVVVYPKSEIANRYFFYLLTFMNLGQYSVAAAQPGLSVENISQLRINFPPITEQTQIALFLDHEVGKIDALIAEQEKLIALLKEKRQAVISHAVTKGLNPDVPMKDSGVEWLGQVPEHWDVVPIKQLVSIPVTDGPHETPEFLDEGIPFVSAEAVSSGRVDFDKIRGFISQEAHALYSKKYKPRLHDIYLVKSGATTGVSAIVETTNEFNIWSPLAVIRCAEKVLPYFMLNAVRSREFLQGVTLNWSFGTQQNIGMNVIENLRIPVPPIQEQDEIICYLDKNLSKFDVLVDNALRAVEFLRERRSALISAAVTGKIDVRGWQPPAAQ